MKILITLIPLFFIVSTTYSQKKATPNEFIYSYDATGNRVKRSLPNIGIIKKYTAFDNEDSIVEEDNEEIADIFGQNNNQDAFPTILYPNPTSGHFTLSLPDYKQGEQVYLQAISQTGQIILEDRYKEFSRSFDISSVPPNTYILKITVGNKHVIKRILKK